MTELKQLTLAKAAAVLKVPAPATDAIFQGVSIDTRSLQPDDLFVALRGPNFDGHSFVSQAEKKGACGAVITHEVDTALPTLLVDDARLALGQLGAARRAALDIPVVAVTGSNGKTSVKEMTRAILAQHGVVLATQGNFNNDIGLPLTLLRLDASHAYAVIEMGANHPGEIAYLTELTRPSVAVINNAGPAHLEGFGDLAGVARAKGEIYQGLGHNGTAVINADDAFAEYWIGITAEKHRVLFGIDNPAAQVRASDIEENASGVRFTLSAHGEAIAIELALPGRHNVMNALAASAAAMAAGASSAAVKAGLESVRPVQGRLQVIAGHHGARIIDDTYNANPASLRAGLAVLMAGAGSRILVLGDMGELGDAAEALHAEAGEQARAAGVDRLFASGKLSRAAVAAFGEDGRHFPDYEALVAALMPELGQDVTVLIKGSRSAHMERVVEALAKH